MCNRLNPPRRFTNPRATFSRITKTERASGSNWMIAGGEIKGGARFFPGPICSPVWASLKVSFKTVICLPVLERCDHVGGSSPGPGHTWNGWVCTCEASRLHPKQIKKTHVNTGLCATHTWSLTVTFITQSWADRRECLDMWRNWPQGRKTDQNWSYLIGQNIKVLPAWSSNYLLKRLLKSPPWFSQHAFGNRGILRIYCLQMASEGRGQGPQLRADASTL